MKLPGIKLFSLTGRGALITGGSKGLGYAMAAALASAGANLVLAARSKEEGETAARELQQDFGTKVSFITTDVTDEKQVHALVAGAVRFLGKIDILINSAGINIRGPIDELSPSDFDKVININVKGTWLCCRAVVPHMKQQKSGKIINLASTLGLIGLANRTPYASSKGAVVQMTRALALELAEYNINVNALCPGPFLTEMNKSIADTEDGQRFVVGATALGRWARLEEIQGAALLLASDAGSYMVGSMVTVDGGWTAR